MNCGRIFALFMAFLYEGLLLAQPAPMVIGANDNFANVSLLDYISFYRDESGSLTPDRVLLDPYVQARFRNVEGEGVYLSGDGVFWMRVRFDNQSQDSVSLIMTGSYPYLDYIDVYEMENLALVKTISRGDRAGPHTNAYRYHKIPLEIQPGIQTFYFRLKTTGPMSFRFYGWSPLSFSDFVRWDYLLLGTLFGFFAVMIGYNLLLAVWFRNRSYFLYVGYIISYSTVQLIITGVLQEILPFNSARAFILNEGLVISTEVTGILSCSFAILFLNLRQASPSLVKAIYAFFLISVSNIIACVMGYDHAVSLLLLTNGFCSTLLLIAAIKQCARSYRPAYFYLMAWGVMIVFNLVTTSHIAGLIPDFSFAPWSQMVGGAIELVLLSLALGDKVRLEQEINHSEIKTLNSSLNHANDRLKLESEEFPEYIDHQSIGGSTQRIQFSR